MFTGLVEAVGKVLSFENRQDAWYLRLGVESVIVDSMCIGDSLACNGCCLTVVSKAEGELGFELLEETVRLTNFEYVRVGDLVNLERSLLAGGRLGGHFVSGHIDIRSKVCIFERRGKNYYMTVFIPEEFRKYVVYKGSITIDGISLTIAEDLGDRLAVWLIPHTLEVTNLCVCDEGKYVNLEFDILAKYVEKISSGERSE